MDILGLTTTEQIRNVLTVSPVDLSDETIDGYGIGDDLGAMLDKAVPEWDQLVAADDAKTRSLRLVAKYYCAGTIARTAQAFVLKKDTDGSNEGQRSDKDGWLWMAPTLLAQANAHLTDLQNALGLIPEPVVMSVIGRVVPDRDVITTPRA